MNILFFIILFEGFFFHSLAASFNEVKGVLGRIEWHLAMRLQIATSPTVACKVPVGTSQMNTSLDLLHREAKCLVR